MSSSPFGTVDDDDDDDDAWLDDVAPASTSDVDRSLTRGDDDALGEDDWMRGANSSSSASASPMGARAAVTHAHAMYAQGQSSGSHAARGLFGDSTPSASASPTGRAVVVERSTPAFEPTPPGAMYGAPSSPPPFVEYAEKDLGALFGGADDGDDWISSGASVAPVEARASAFPVTPDAVRAVEPSPLPATSVQYAAAAPFASPMIKDDGTDFFNDLGADEDDGTETSGFGGAIPVPFGSPMDAGVVHATSPAVHASVSPSPPSPPPQTFAEDANEYASAPLAAQPTAKAHFIEEVAAPQLAPSPPPQESFYEEQYAPAEFSHAEFTSAYEATFEQTAHVPETSEQTYAQDASYSNEQQYHEYDASHVMQPPESETPRAGHYYHAQQEYAPDVNEASPAAVSAAPAAIPPPPQVSYHEPVVETPAPPMISVYSGSTENFPRVSSSNSVTDMYSPATTPAPEPQARPTFMVPSPIQPSPAAPYAPVVGHYEQQPSMMQNSGYAAYEPRAPMQSTYAAPPATNVNASYQTSEAQNLEYAAYSETPSSRAVKYDDTNRSPDGRPAHVAMSFGFGGSLILSGPGYAGGRTSHGTSIPPCSLRVHSVRTLLADGNSLGVNYVRSLEQIRGPLAGQRVDNVIKMVDALLNSNGDTRRDSEVLLWLVLSAMLRHKGVLTLEGDILGENRKSALAEISTIIAGDGAGASGDGWASASAGVSPLNPAESSDARAIVQVENMLISGQRGAALNLAIQAKLWPHAILLAGHLGGKHYQDTIAQMSMSVCRAGSPLHTLEVLMAGFPQELIASRDGGQSRICELLPRWREHMAILCSNPTNGSEIVLKALGDELCMAQNDISAAHVAYALSHEKPSAYSYNSRMCLVNADHRKQPRTYATPTAIKLTELLECALLGSNSQAQLPSLLPYKLIYAGALAEIGHLREALSYVENVLKCLRSLDKMNPEVNVVRVGTLAAQMEHRLQDGLRSKGGNLAGAAVGAAKTLVSGFKGLLDRSVSTLFGDESESQAPLGGANVQHQPHQMQPANPAPYVAHTPTMHHASYQTQKPTPVSAPPPPPQQAPPPPQQQQHQHQHQHQHQQQQQQRPQSQSQSSQGMHASGGSGLLRSVSSLFVGSSTPAAEAPKAPPADDNVFYYNETLKMWCERGKEPTQEALPQGAPPVRSESPTSSAGAPPPGPPPMMAANHNTQQLRQGGIHSRYVDTFNTAPHAQQSPANVAPAQGFVPMAPSAGAAPKAPGQFFMPAPVAQHSRDASTESYSSQSQHSHEFYGYNNAQHTAEPAMSSSQGGGALPTPPDIDPSSLLAPSSMTHPGSLPNKRHAYDSQPAQVIAEELTELKLN